MAECEGGVYGEKCFHVTVRCQCCYLFCMHYGTFQTRSDMNRVRCRDHIVSTLTCWRVPANYLFRYVSADRVL